MTSVPHPYVRERRFVVDSRHRGLRLDRFISRAIPRLSRSKACSAIRAGNIHFACGRTSKPGSRTREHDVVVVLESFADEAVQYDEVTLLHETDRLVAFDKPAGMVTHPTATRYRNSLQLYAQLHGWPDVAIVHRLDRHTSGTIVLAVTREAAADLSRAFEKGEVTKEYLAIVLDPARMHRVGQRDGIDTPLGFNSSSRLPHLEMGPGNLTCATRWVCLERRGDLALLQVAIEGGRQHQIRAHCAMFGTPLAGDALYGHGVDYFMGLTEGRADPEKMRCERHALHASRLQFCDADKQVDVSSPLPEMFKRLLGTS